MGYCTRLANLEAAKAAGFDYVELATSEIAALTDAEFEQAAARIRELGLPVPAMNLFLPATLKVTGPDIDRDRQMAYVKKAFARLERISTTIVVFGSRRASSARGFLERSGDQAARRIRPPHRLRPGREDHHRRRAAAPEETNIINSAAEARAGGGDRRSQLPVDGGLLPPPASVKEDPSIIVRARDTSHLHMANPEGRVFPRAAGEYDYAPFFAALRTIGYDRRISIEASTKAFEADAPQAIALLRRALQ